MIFVTVGAAEKGIEFDRLVLKMDSMASRLSLPIVMQIGSSSYTPQRADFFSYKKFDEMLGYFHAAKLVVGHCGSGTVLNALAAGVPLIVVPRLQKFGEADTDNHQLHLAKKLEAREGVRVVYDLEMLESTVVDMLSLPHVKYRPSKTRQTLLSAIRDFVNRAE